MDGEVEVQELITDLAEMGQIPNGKVGSDNNNNKRLTNIKQPLGTTDEEDAMRLSKIY